MQSIKKKAVTCHAGARDAYQISVALEQAGLLECLVTDLFLPPVIGRKVSKKYTSELPYNKVRNTYSNLIRQKIFKQPYSVTDQILTNRALNEAIKHDANLFLYSYTALDAFEYIKQQHLKNQCFLFQLHPHPLSIRKLLTEELSLSPQAKESLMREPEMYLDEAQIKQLNDESLLADHVFVASTYTKQTLIENKVSPDKITIIPYGVEASKFSLKPSYDEQNGTIKLVFVGQMIQRKGLGYLFEALKLLNSKNIELTLIGRGVIDNHLISEYKKYLDIRVKINLTHDELVYELQAHDMLVFPSLVEGFGHVILEAMSAGLPVLCTPNTAGPDVFVNGTEGVIVPIRNAEAIAEKIEYFIHHKKELAIMGISAGQTARAFSWEKFRSGILQFYNSFTITSDAQ
jgi:glycosyltransferase involved in cell wall biosynthesis